MADRMIGLAKPLLSEEEFAAVREVLESGQLASGPRVRAFEAEFAAFCGARHAVATSNGTTALSTALQAAGVRPGDTVITTAFSFIATANAIVHAGARPVFADIDPATYNISPSSLREVLGRHPEASAVLVVHLYGQPCAMGEIRRLAEDSGLILVEDCAQAHGALYDGEMVGTFGRAGSFSFYATKNMTTGEGGMVTTGDEAVAARARKLINHGRAGQYFHDEIGFNHRMTDIVAAIGRVQLKRLPSFNARRGANAARLTTLLADIPQVKSPVSAPNCSHVYHQYTIRAEQRDELNEWLNAHGVGSGVIYPVPLHRQPPYLHRPGWQPLPEAERAAGEVLSLPVHPALTDTELERVAGAVRAFYGSRQA